MESPVDLTTLFFLVVLLRQAQPALGWTGCCGATWNQSSGSSHRWPLVRETECTQQTCCDNDLEGSNPGSSLQPGSLEVGVRYYSEGSRGKPTPIATLSVSWKYSDSAVAPVDSVKVTVSLDQSHQVLCYSVSPDLESVAVHKLPNPMDSNSCQSSYSVTVKVLLGGSSSSSHVVSLEKKVLVEDCWAAVGKNRSLEVCGVQIPSTPLNVSAELRVNSSTGVSTIAVNWSPPLHHNTPVGMYIVKLYYEGKDSGFPGLETFILERVSPTERSISMSSEEKEEVASVVSVKVGAAVRLDGKTYSPACCLEYAGMCYRSGSLPKISVTTEAATLSPTNLPPPTAAPATNSSSRTATQTPSRELSADTSRWIVVGASVVGGVLVLAVCLTAVAVAALAVGLRRKTEQSGSMLLTPAKFEEEASIPSNSVIDTVFLVSSPEESEETQERLRHLVHDLADHGIEAVYYQYERAAQHADSPGALGIARWVEHQFQRCDLVLFACTRTFSTEWSRENGDVMIPVVWSSRHVLDGILPHQDDISRFGVVLMGDNCDIPLTLRRFQVFKLFESGSDNLHSDHLIRYILETPPFAPPRVVCE